MPMYIVSGKNGQLLDYCESIAIAKDSCAKALLKNPKRILDIEKNGKRLYRVSRESDIIVYMNETTGTKSFRKLSDIRSRMTADRPSYIAVYYDRKGTFGTLEHARKEAVGMVLEFNDHVTICKNYVGDPYGIVWKEGSKWVWELRWRGTAYIFDPKTGKTVRRY